MAYIDKSYYTEQFGASVEDDGAFQRLADIASDLVYDICTVKPQEKDLVDSSFKKAVAYQVELLYEQGGVSAIQGQSEAALASGSESLGDYSVSGGSGSQTQLKFHKGIPISPMTEMLLSRLGLLCCWAYADYYRRRCSDGKL